MSENNKNNAGKNGEEPVAVQRVRPFFNRLLVLFLMGAVLWNSDFVWQIPEAEAFLSKYFPHQAGHMAKRRQTLGENDKFVQEIAQERDAAVQEADEIKAESEQIRAKQDEICAYLREAAAMFRVETQKVEAAVQFKEGDFPPPIKCDGANPEICRQIKREDGKVNDLCPEIGSE